MTCSYCLGTSFLVQAILVSSTTRKNKKKKKKVYMCDRPGVYLCGCDRGVCERWMCDRGGVLWGVCERCSCLLITCLPSESRTRN